MHILYVAIGSFFFHKTVPFLSSGKKQNYKIYAVNFT